MSTFIQVVEIFIISFFAVLNTIYLAFLVYALVGLVAYRRSLWRSDLRTMLSAHSFRPISILVPAHNEQDTIVATLRSLLTLRYPECEIVVVNDGSTDQTLERLRHAFSLQPVPAATRQLLSSRPVRGVYRALHHPHLRVVDKYQGGKSDALNAGINASSYPLFCTMDADSILEPDALLRIARAFAEDDRVLAAGGIIRVINGSKVEDGRVVERRTPSRPMVLIQALEYVRAFLGGRAPLARMNGLLILSGAFALLRKDAVVAVGGYDTNTVCEDMEIIVRLQRWAREEKNGGKVLFLPDPVCWTQAPSDWRSLLSQRDRWQRGLLESLWLNKRTFLNPRYGSLGMVAMPYYLVFEALGPVVELFGYVFLVTLGVTGRLSLFVALMFFVFAILYGIILSIIALVLDDLLFKRYEHARDFAKMLGAAFLEFLGYRQVLAFQRTKAFFTLLVRRRRWGKQRRRVIPDTEGRQEVA